MALWPQARACLRRPPFFHTLFGRHRCVDGVCHSSPLVSLREGRAEVEGDGGGRETQKEKTREDGAQQRSVLVCANQRTHTVDVPCLTHTQREDKTRHGNGDTHTWGWMRRQDTTHKGGKGREKTRGGSSQDTHHYTKEKEKGKKTMTKPKDNEER